MECMTENDWKMVDFKSRDLITQWLKTLNVKSVQETTGNCCIDLIFDTCKHKVGVEIKNRTFASDKFGDVFAEEYKLIGSQRRMDDGQFQKVIAINVFTDGTFAVANLLSPLARHFRRLCPTTSLVKGGSKELVWKDCLSLPQQMKVRFWKDASGKFQFKRLT